MRAVVCLVCLGSASASAQPLEPWPVARAPHLEVAVATEGHVAVVQDAMDPTPTGLAGARGTLRWIGKHNYYIGTPVVGFDAEGGWASSSSLAYGFHLQAGLRAHMHLWNGLGHYIGVLAGVGRDAIGDAVPAAWTAPVDAFYQWHIGRSRIMGFHAGPRFALERSMGWNTGFDVKFLGDSGSLSAFAPRDVAISIDANQIAGTTYVGLSVGVGSRQSPGYWVR